eukprot:8162097-Prorocentrum_lima.AAC.1
MPDREGMPKRIQSAFVGLKASYSGHSDIVLPHLHTGKAVSCLCSTFAPMIVQCLEDRHCAII